MEPLLGGGGVCTSGSVSGSESGGVRLGTGGGGHTSVDGSGLSCLTKSSARATTTLYSDLCCCRPHVVVCLLGSNNGAALVASRLAQYGFKRASFWIDTCPERFSLYVWLGITSTTA